jgi:YggT family protein
MYIIDRIVWFISSAVTIITVAVIVLMILRLVVDAMDLNPFGWTSRTTRRLTDGLVIPMRAGLRQFRGMDPRFAPIAVILLAIVLRIFILWLLETVADTIIGVLDNMQRGSVTGVLAYILAGLLSLYMAMIIIRVVFSWGQISYRNRFMRFMVDVTEPLLGPLRRMIPPIRWIDISPMVALLIVWICRAAILGMLLPGRRSF